MRARHYLDPRARLASCAAGRARAGADNGAMSVVRVEPWGNGELTLLGARVPSAPQRGRGVLRPEARAGLQREPPSVAPESARYLESPGGELYSVTHAALRARRGVVLLCGPFGIERERAYLTLVQWARLLAAQGFEVLRFDYRGTGESSGDFESMTLARWLEDVSFCAGRLRAAHPGEVLVLQGVRLGALLAAELFRASVGDALLLWAPPDSAEELLRETLRHDLVAQRLAKLDRAPRLRAELARALADGKSVSVDGYFWSPALWSEACRHPLCVPAPDEPRPWTALATAAGSEALLARGLAGHLERVEADTFWSSSSPLLVPESTRFFTASLAWLDAHVPRAGADELAPTAPSLAALPCTART